VTTLVIIITFKVGKGATTSLKNETDLLIQLQVKLFDAELTRDPFLNREGRRRMAQLMEFLRNRLWCGILIFFFKSSYLKLISLLECISGGFRIAVDEPANLDLHESRHQLVKQIANIVDQRLAFLVKVDKVSLYWMKKMCVIDY
jgi:hypothetical protein